MCSHRQDRAPFSSSSNSFFLSSLEDDFARSFFHLVSIVGSPEENLGSTRAGGERERERDGTSSIKEWAVEKALGLFFRLLFTLSSLLLSVSSALSLSSLFFSPELVSYVCIIAPVKSLLMRNVLQRKKVRQI